MLIIYNRFCNNLFKFTSILIMLLLVSCGPKKLLNVKNQLLINEEILTKTLNIVGDSRFNSKNIYAECFIAMYEAYNTKDVKKNSINNQIKGFKKISLSNDKINYDFSSLVAFYKVLELNLVKSQLIENEKNKIFNIYENELGSRKFKYSFEYGTNVAEVIFNNFKNNEGFTIINDIDELGFNHPKNFTNISNETLKNYSKEILKINNNLSDLQKIICNYWEGNDKNKVKRINIEGHWFSLLSQRIRNSNLDISEIMKIYALLGLTINEAYKIGEYEEYKNTYKRPKDIINESLNKNWMPYLKNYDNEYNSVNSVVSLSASNIISNFFKNDSAFIDSSIYNYIGMTRKYNSLEEAASESSISRAYGGLHFIFVVNEAAEQGKNLAKKILTKIQ